MLQFRILIGELVTDHQKKFFMITSLMISLSLSIETGVKVENLLLILPESHLVSAALEDEYRNYPNFGKSAITMMCLKFFLGKLEWLGGLFSCFRFVF